jgi:hypothetical protein
MAALRACIHRTVLMMPACCARLQTLLQLHNELGLKTILPA